MPGGGSGEEALKGENLTPWGKNHRGRRNTAEPILLWRNVNFFRAVD